MRHLLHALLAAAPVLLVAGVARGQEPRSEAWVKPAAGADRPPLLPAQPAGGPAGYIVPTAADDRSPGAARLAQDELADLQKELAKAQAQTVAAQAAGAGQPEDPLRKRIELLEKQIETQQKMIQLLVDQARKQPVAGAPADQIATLEGRSLQAARRDVELSQAIDTVTDHIDANERNGPRLPAQLKELFLPSGTNESPLSIYGTLSVGYSKILGDTATAANGAGRPPTPGGFYFGEFTPDFLLKLNDWIFLEAEIGIGSDGSVSAGSFAQVDFFLTDWLTISAGRIVAPIGWYNLRNNPWMNKLPADAPGSAPLLWLQVLPQMSLLGVQAQGSFYLGCSPLKLEYSAYVSNGLNLTPAAAGAPTINELANLENMTSTWSSITNDKAFGGRLGLWWPEMGLEAGISGLFNGDYVAGGFEDQITLFAVDLNYHKGDWDVRAEYGRTYQQAGSFGFGNITRQGMYAQVAYRPLDACNRYLQNTELVYRYSYVDFKGIDPATLDLTTFGTPVDVPVRRNQNEIGINYYVTPRLVMKTAYQINNEPGFHLHDNQFIAELDWGW
ncbi:MAG TPA: hypothetical protein VH120_15250 [Gemmataceae bacterium]|nr:hypothetical protein [Gemmataceae bacterium]